MDDSVDVQIRVFGMIDDVIESVLSCSSFCGSVGRDGGVDVSDNQSQFRFCRFRQFESQVDLFEEVLLGGEKVDLVRMFKSDEEAVVNF